MTATCHSEKRCFRCGEVKSLSEFYRHREMADGHLNKCKPCARADVRANRLARSDYYREYESERASRPHRVAARAAYAKANPAQFRRYRKRWIERNPEKRAAHNALNNAKRSGRIEQEPCAECGREDSHAHHHDYSAPLDVTWLCAWCHAQEHKRERAKRRSQPMTETRADKWPVKIPADLLADLETMAESEGVTTDEMAVALLQTGRICYERARESAKAGSNG